MANLVEKHVFIRLEESIPGTGHFARFNHTRRYKSAIVRCRVNRQDGEKITIIAEGNNNPEFDGKYRKDTTSSLILMPGTWDIRVEEQHGIEGMGPIGVWRETTLDPPTTEVEVACLKCGKITTVSALRAETSDLPICCRCGRLMTPEAARKLTR